MEYSNQILRVFTSLLTFIMAWMILPSILMLFWVSLFISSTNMLFNDKNTSNSGEEKFWWYSYNAVKSKIESDMNRMGKIIDEKIEHWWELSTLIIIDKQYQWKKVIVWWKQLTPWLDYFVWTPNYAVLWIKKEDFLPPLGWDYIIWLTSQKGGVYQIFSTLKNSETWSTIVLSIWSFSSKKFKIFKKWSDYSQNFKFWIILEKSYQNYLSYWDILDGHEVVWVSEDWITITFDTIINSNSLKLISDSKFLIPLDLF